MVNKNPNLHGIGDKEACKTTTELEIQRSICARINGITITGQKMCRPGERITPYSLREARPSTHSYIGGIRKMVR